MTLEKKPFTRYKLDEEIKENDFTFTIRLNPAERLVLEDCKKALDIKSNSKCLKVMGLVIGRNVLFSVFGKKMLKYLSSKERQRYSDFKSID